MALDVDSVLRRINQFGPYQIRISVMFLFIFLPITYQTLIMVFAAYEPPWACANNSTTCLESNSSSALSKVYSTATRPIELYDRRCSLNRSDWKFADYNLYEGPHETIVDQVRKEMFRAVYDGKALSPRASSYDGLAQLPKSRCLRPKSW